MTHFTRISALIGATLLVAGTSAVAEDWPQWRGPDGTNVSNESLWSPEGRDEPVWRANVGLGYSSFAIRDGRAITIGHADGEDRDTVYCFDAITGEEIWTHSYPCERHNLYHIGGAQSTPTIDGDHVYVLNREGDFKCLTFESGDVVWERDLKGDYGLEYPVWMFSASPLIRGDQVIVNVGKVLCLDKMTGVEIWASRDTGHAYSTPVMMDAHGKSNMLVFNGDGLVVLDPANGEVRSVFPWVTDNDVNAATPVVLGNRIFISSGYNHGCAMVELTPDGLEKVWESKVMRTHMSGAVLFEGNLYGFDDSTLKCIDPDGNELWRKRGLGKGALMIADGKLIVLSSKGDLIIAEASPDGFEQLTKTRVLKGGVYWTSPVLANGLIYCRNSEGEIVCRDHRVSGS